VQEALKGGNELFGQLFEKYMQNLQMGVQQQQNKQVGRWGVQPMSPQGPQGQAQGPQGQAQESQGQA